MTISETAHEFSSESVVIVYENDSTDSSCAMLRNWQRRHRSGQIFVICEQRGVVGASKLSGGRGRTQRLADCRNRVLAELRRVEKDAQPGSSSSGRFDVVVWIDADLGEHAWAPSDVSRVARQVLRGQQDAVCANGVASNSDWHYDRFALRAPGWFNVSAAMDRQGMDAFIGPRSVCFDPLLPSPGLAYPVSSCFGGLAVYARAAFDDCAYSGAHDECEHVLLHECLASRVGGARIAVQSDLRLVYWGMPSEWTTQIGAWEQHGGLVAAAPLDKDATVLWTTAHAAGWYWWPINALGGRVFDPHAEDRIPQPLR